MGTSARSVLSPFSPRLATPLSRLGTLSRLSEERTAGTSGAHVHAWLSERLASVGRQQRGLWGRACDYVLGRRFVV